MHTHGLLRVDRYASEQQRLAWVFCKGDQCGDQGLQAGGGIPRCHCVRFRSDSTCPDDSFTLRMPPKAENLKLSPSKARLGATDANFLGHSISPAGLCPNAEKVSALINMPMPTDVKQIRTLMGGINYYRNFLPKLSKRLRPINPLLRKGVKFQFTPAMEKFCLLYTSPSPRDQRGSRMPSSA